MSTSTTTANPSANSGSGEPPAKKAKLEGEGDPPAAQVKLDPAKFFLGETKDFKVREKIQQAQIPAKTSDAISKVCGECGEFCTNLQDDKIPSKLLITAVAKASSSGISTYANSLAYGTSGCLFEPVQPEFSRVRFDKMPRPSPDATLDQALRLFAGVRGPRVYAVMPVMVVLSQTSAMDVAPLVDAFLKDGLTNARACMLELESFNEQASAFCLHCPVFRRVFYNSNILFAARKILAILQQEIEVAKKRPVL